MTGITTKHDTSIRSLTATNDNVGVKSYLLLRYPPGGRQPIHVHDESQFISPLQGVAKVFVGKKMWILFPGSGLWIPGNVPHGLEAVDNLITQNIYFFSESSARFGGEAYGTRISLLMLALMKSAGDSPLTPERKSWIYALMNDELPQLPLAILCNIVLPEERRLQKICDALRLNPGNNDTLEWWSKQAGASERTIARLFRKETQLGFNEWRQQIRLSEALCRLACGSTVNQAAEQLGYTSSSAFIAMFRKKLGASPLRYFQAGACLGKN